MSSSVSDDLPEPPVPVMPSTGAPDRAAASRMGASNSIESVPASTPVMSRARSACEPPSAPSAVTAVGVAAAVSHSATIVAIMPTRPSRWPSSGVKMRATP